MEKKQRTLPVVVSFALYVTALILHEVLIYGDSKRVLSTPHDPPKLDLAHKNKQIEKALTSYGKPRLILRKTLDIKIKSK